MFYERNRDDNGAIQRLFRTNLRAFATMTENHLNDTNRVTTTVAGSNFGNMILVPGPNGFMHVLHHGFTHTAELGGATSIVAIHGNLSEANLKVIPAETIVTQAGNNVGRRSAVECPSFHSILGTKSAEEFRALALLRTGSSRKNLITFSSVPVPFPSHVAPGRSDPVTSQLSSSTPLQQKTTMTIKSPSPKWTKVVPRNFC